MAFIIDDTDTVSASKFQEVKTFLVSLVNKMLIGDNAIKVGIVTYGDGAATSFPLKQYSTASDVMSATKNLAQGNLAYSRTLRCLEKAISYTQYDFFTKENGDRADAINFYVVLTYGGTYGSNFTEYISALQCNTSIDIFIFGVNINSIDDADYQGAVSQGRYKKATSFTAHECDSTVFTTITQCQGLASTPTTCTTATSDITTDSSTTHAANSTSDEKKRSSVVNWTIIIIIIQITVLVLGSAIFAFVCKRCNKDKVKKSPR
ncbi:vitrin-like isoform X2 [Saccostrea cucullata]|uniref:vitrin-like isoform X2 n=1 Tax=Saccostrea cuccullata TaxID=36930 RepID=UPI002ED3FE72